MFIRGNIGCPGQKFQAPGLVKPHLPGMPWHSLSWNCQSGIDPHRQKDTGIYDMDSPACLRLTDPHYDPFEERDNHAHFPEINKIPDPPRHNSWEGFECINSYLIIIVPMVCNNGLH
jgi:hypothetical protein